MSSSLEFLAFPPLGPVEKLRLGATIFHASRIEDWKELENELVEDWLVRWSGRGTFDKIWKPLLRAKLGDAYRRTSAAFIWATIARLYAARRSGMKRELFGYLPGGYARLLAAFATRLTEAGVRIRTGRPAKRISEEEGGLAIAFDDGVERFDQVACTMPPRVASKLIAGLSPAERTLFDGVEYQGIVCASALLPQPLTKFYVTNITDDWVPFTGVIDMSALVDRNQFGGNALIYLPKYVAPDDPLFDRSDGEIRESFLGALERMYPGFDRRSALGFRVSRVRQVFPIPTTGYSSRVPPVKTSIPGLWTINSSHIVNGTLNVNQTVDLAERAAAQMIASPARTPKEVAA